MPTMPPYLETATVDTPLGYYLRRSGRTEYWTGREWIVPVSSTPAPAPAPMPMPMPMPQQPAAPVQFPSTSIAYRPLHRRRGLNKWMGIFTMGMWNLLVQLPCAIVYGITGREAKLRHR